MMANKFDSWCIVSINGRDSIVKIKHIGRGKFRIIEVFNGDLKVDNIVDASDVLDCRVQIVE
jgi:hypothetical protein